MPSLSNSPWIRGAPHSGLAMLISRISLRISVGKVGRPPRRRDLQRQYDRNPARCHFITVSGFKTARAFRTVGANRYSPARIKRSIALNVCLCGDCIAPRKKAERDHHDRADHSPDIFWYPQRTRDHPKRGEGTDREDQSIVAHRLRRRDWNCGAVTGLLSRACWFEHGGERKPD